MEDLRKMLRFAGSTGCDQRNSALDNSLRAFSTRISSIPPPGRSRVGLDVAVVRHLDACLFENLNQAVQSITVPSFDLNEPAIVVLQ